jgi:hypothetical protein
MVAVTDVVKTGRDKMVIKDLTGVATASASETDMFSGDKAQANGWIDMGPWEGGSVLVGLLETNGGGGSIRAYSPLDPANKNTTKYPLCTAQTLAASSPGGFILGMVGSHLKLTQQRSGATNMITKFRVTLIKPPGGMSG